MKESVVLLPGLQSDYPSWSYQTEHFGDRYNVVVPSGYHDNVTIDAMAAAIEPQLPERFHLVVWSMGGYIGFRMLADMADRISSLVCIATSARPENPDSTRRRLENLAVAERDGMLAANIKTMAFSCQDIDAVPPDRLKAVQDAAVKLGVKAYGAQQHAIINRDDSRPVIAGVRCPTLVIVGDNDKVTPPDCSEEIHRAIAGSRLVILDNCGHCPPLEKPETVNAILEEWFADCAAQGLSVAR
ncbi:alpha/beta hydrolase [Hoeflea sp. WL0058]|uniref:Alpha/beta hydrolase n=1 Tax=Flavimaribacter sediminis TaxID=2865987 RepID=A0AAE2ZP65_9HYPH|nr:alpha/beta hydrolase [Flavimaribacter sediminis]MBW8639524.1 alpha/beta hydrolase [Flavimaribacter sediminis]